MPRGNLFEVPALAAGMPLPFNAGTPNRRFMERKHLQNLDVSWGHEPLERGCVEDQPQQSRSGNMLRLVDDDTAALRFMEREHLQNNDVSWGHEPLERGCVEDQPQQS